jgi:uncharacterized membrane protein
MARHWFRDDVGSRLAERTALMAAIASTGRTFGRGLMPRTMAGQAVATGLTGSVNYGLIVTSQSVLWAGASMLAPALLPADPPEGSNPARAYRARVRLLAYGTYATAALAARPLQRLVPPDPQEPVRRAVARSALHRLEVVSVVGLIATGIQDSAASALSSADLTPRSRRLLGSGLMMAGGAALATAAVHRERIRRAKATGEPAPPLSASSVGAGAATAIGLTVLGKAETLAARGIGGVLPDAVPTPAATAVGHVICLGALGAGIWQGVEALYSSVETSGSAMESLHAEAPDDAHVSGGPSSAIEWARMSREGRRFAALPLSRDEIAGVMGSAVADPVRVFVPLAASDSPQARARLAVQEMEALGAFDRSVIVLCSPTGTGYVNYVMAEAVEYLTRGDCAVVSTQYSLRPSFLSLDRVSVGRANATELLYAVQARVATMPEGRQPRVVLFGESLGAHTAQDVALHRGAAGFTDLGIERALFIGTPDESGWARQWRDDPVGTDPRGIVAEVDSFEQFLALPHARSSAARIVLVSHDEDPITKFGPALAIREPHWLDPDRVKRPFGIPPEMEWRPLVTFFVTVADIMNSMTVVPGQFGSEGHDYREDIARFVSTVYALPCTPVELAGIEEALRARELSIAESRLLADHFSAVRESAASALSGWGVDAGAADALIDDEVLRQRELARGGGTSRAARGGEVPPEDAGASGPRVDAPGDA